MVFIGRFTTGVVRSVIAEAKLVTSLLGVVDANTTLLSETPPLVNALRLPL